MNIYNEGEESRVVVVSVDSGWFTARRPPWIWRNGCELGRFRNNGGGVLWASVKERRRAQKRSTARLDDAVRGRE